MLLPAPGLGERERTCLDARLLYRGEDQATVLAHAQLCTKVPGDTHTGPQLAG
jgi:hypothetical protein